MKDDKIFNRKCAGDDKEYTKEEEAYLSKLSKEYAEKIFGKKNEGNK